MLIYLYSFMILFHKDFFTLIKINCGCKDHQIVELDIHLLLLRKHKKFDDYAVARFCSSEPNSHYLTGY